MTINGGKTPGQACLRAIRAVINAGSYAAAARELNMTHAAIAQQIHGFEAKLV
ncbi:DNA-binding transcriptional LysR family regulator [Paenochrobactrum gallinarii]|uniref:DNA-binding transcriptional LysR family regulator n=1 Tax=Paenochrobactrum gallinarii TaxID=643673 RepID=A0A841LYH0_9HYPH|nr:LysR family transcriptional regulator [Paenochrobactrum gallinarii]MBB6262446.1 DNA-binding transcriptional LysR family regulator [Paenochrobactrum gallinarii]